MKRLYGSSSRSTVYFFPYGLQQFVGCKFSICFSAELMYVHQWSAILFGFSRRIKKIFCSNTKTFWRVFLALGREQRFGSLQSGWCLVQSSPCSFIFKIIWSIYSPFSMKVAHKTYGHLFMFPHEQTSDPTDWWLAASAALWAIFKIGLDNVQMFLLLISKDFLKSFVFHQ